MKRNEVATSYGRCCMSADFFDDFYDTLFQSSKEIRAHFEHTEMAAQKALIKNGINFLLMSAEGSFSSNKKLEQLGESHSKQNMNIDPKLYQVWIKALLNTVEKHDKKITPALLAQWENVLNDGVAKIATKY